MQLQQTTRPKDWAIAAVAAYMAIFILRGALVLGLSLALYAYRDHPGWSNLFGLVNLIK